MELLKQLEVLDQELQKQYRSEDINFEQLATFF